MELLTVLEALCSSVGAGGQAQAADTAAVFLKETCTQVGRDALGSVTGFRHCGKKNAPLILLEAHIDEIGFVVTGIDEHGELAVVDPLSRDRTSRHWTFDEIISQATGLWSYTAAA